MDRTIRSTIINWLMCQGYDRAQVNPEMDDGRIAELLWRELLDRVGWSTLIRRRD